MIKMCNFGRTPKGLSEDVRAAVSRVLDSETHILGNEVTRFEQEWAGACGKEFGVGVGNGMDAIELSLRAIGVGQGDEVVVPSMTAFASALAITRAGATPVFADIEPSSALMSLHSARRCLSKRTKAIVLVHLYGQVRDMSEWIALCRDNQIELIEDCAQAHLACLNGRVAGSFGIASAFSFYPTKNLGAVGDAGMIVAGCAELARRAARLRNYGQSARYQHDVLGVNSRLDEIQAAILQAKLKWLPQMTDRRRAIAARYDFGITSPYITLLTKPAETAAHVYHQYVITSPYRDELRHFLAERKIETLIHYPQVLSRQLPYEHAQRDPLGVVHAERHAATCLSLPCDPWLTTSEVDHVVCALNDFVPAC
jgi:dTDP-4-amino-4,6-dideoxygalactose transaminase